MTAIYSAMSTPTAVAMLPVAWIVGGHDGGWLAAGVAQSATMRLADANA